MLSGSSQRLPYHALPFCEAVPRAPKPRLDIILDPQARGEFLRQQRMARRLSLAGMATRIGCAESTLVGWEYDRIRPNPRFWSSLSCFFGNDEWRQSLR